MLTFVLLVNKIKLIFLIIQFNVIPGFMFALTKICNLCQVHFVPNEQGKLISASVDGLICTFDTTGDINDDDHLDSVSLGFNSISASC